MQLIKKSDLTFEDEILGQLDGKVFPIESYINYDQFLFIGHGSIVSIKNLSEFSSKCWTHFVRKYSNTKNTSKHYKSFA